MTMKAGVPVRANALARDCGRPVPDFYDLTDRTPFEESESVLAEPPDEPGLRAGARHGLCSVPLRPVRCIRRG